jgi:three-Cys-motif partner protein
MTLGPFDICPSCGEFVGGSEGTCSLCGEPLENLSTDTESADDLASGGGVIEQIHDWSQVKHEIVEAYLGQYTTILTKQSFVKRLVYVDAFAGTGYAENIDTGQIVPGSATRAMLVQPPFTEIHLIEQRPERIESLRQHVSDLGDQRVTIHQGDATEVLKSTVLPRCRFKDFARALVFLDPYGLSVPWTLLSEIGHMQSVEIFFNFMVVGANRNVLWRDLARVKETQKFLMDRVWGDRTWESVLYERGEVDLFGDTTPVKLSNEKVVEAYRQRLKTDGGFPFVPKPIPVRNSKGATLYYLFFASHNETANRIVSHIFKNGRG